MIPSRLTSRTRGFSLLELMLVITVAAVVLGLGVPNLVQFLRNNELTAAANDLLVVVHAARAEAVKRQLPTTMCFVSNPGADEPACDGNGTQGWISWVDEDGDGVVDSTETVLLRHGALPGQITVITKPAGNDGYISFQPTGFSRPIGATVALAGVVMCDQRGNVALYGTDNSVARGLEITAIGRASITRSASRISSSASLLGGGTCPP